MYDYNFFEDYKIKTKKSQPGTGLMVIILVFAVLALAGYSAYTIDVNNGIKDDIQVLEDEINKPSNIELGQRITSKQELLTNLSTIVTQLQSADITLTSSEPINATVFETINLALPADAEIDSLTINLETLSINGMAAQRSAIAEFEKTLREADWIEDVYVSNITTNLPEENEAVSYTFNLSIEMGGVINENIN